ncbi:hypothetical protein K402DRAFT_394610 [Aulographum hederae CBS 113979]|uniref:Secreted protein n=1 Tax=Aulographum hederae CBS 113979 TaxID=1176131 RepID=A0A6G1GY20_9PEZI|nr:hypothetical protein K402DRAFT_394610 [Aulographum hederae CBS 113979]
MSKWNFPILSTVSILSSKCLFVLLAPSEEAMASPTDRWGRFATVSESSSSSPVASRQSPVAMLWSDVEQSLLGYVWRNKTGTRLLVLWSFERTTVLVVLTLQILREVDVSERILTACACPNQDAELKSLQ